MTTKAILTEAFKTPEIIKMFAARKLDGLRQRLFEIERDSKIGKMELVKADELK
jgi:hypothetical protein